MAKNKLTYFSFTRYEDDPQVIARLVNKGWLDTGVYTPPVDPSVVEADRVANIKLAAGRLITGKLPEWKQRNLSARFTELLEDKVSGKTLSSEKKAEMDAIKAMWSWVKAVRAESDRLEADEDLYVENGNWPEVPE